MLISIKLEENVIWKSYSDIAEKVMMLTPVPFIFTGTIR